MPLPPCSNDDFGILPAANEPHPATLNELRDRFVEEAPETQRDRRLLIHSALTLHIAMVRRYFKDFPIRIWLNGGFITHKTWKAPRDADFAVLVPPDAIRYADRDAAVPLWTLSDVSAHRGQGGPQIVTRKLHTALGLTDAYVVNAHNSAAVEIQRRVWSKVTGPDKNTVEGMEKGFVEVIAGE